MESKYEYLKHCSSELGSLSCLQEASFMYLNKLHRPFIMADTAEVPGKHPSGSNLWSSLLLRGKFGRDNYYTICNS